MENDNFPISGNELSSELIGLNKGSDTQKIKIFKKENQNSPPVRFA